MWFLWFVMWSPLWWILVFSELCMLMWCCEEEWPGRGFFSLALFAAILMFFGDFNIWEWGKVNWQLIPKYGSIYFGVGFLWAVLKYLLRLDKIKVKYREKKWEWAKRHNLESQDMNEPKNLSLWIDSLDYSDKREWEENTEFLSNKSRLISWIGYWPVSVVWTFFSDWIKRFANFLWRRLNWIFKGMHKYILREILADKAVVDQYKRDIRNSD